MILRLIIRRGVGTSVASVGADFKSESKDTPRINNLGIEIYQLLQKMVDDLVNEGIVSKNN